MRKAQVTTFFIMTCSVIACWSCRTQAAAIEPDADAATNINVSLMLDTFLIGGPAAEAGKVSTGTAFLLTKPKEKIVDSRKEPTDSYVIVTAAHVLEDIKSDIATILMRRQDEAGDWHQMPINVQIRNAGAPLWTKNPDPSVDVAVMYLHASPEQWSAIQANTIKIPTTLLAEDDLLKKIKILPGSDLFCLGFPLTVAGNDAGFPLLRRGTVASYPIYPTRKYRAFRFDFEIYPGNSGGPVYFSMDNPPVAERQLLVGRFHGIAGLVSQQVSGKAIENGKQVDKEIRVGVIVPATLIKDTIDQLPPEP